MRECEEMLKIVQRSKDSQLDLAGSSRLVSRRSCIRAKYAEKLNRHASCSTIGQKVQFGHSVTSRLELVAQSSREAKPLANSVLKKLTIRILLSP